MPSLARLDMAMRSWVVAHRLAALTPPLYLLTVLGRFGGIWIVIALGLAAIGRLSWRDASRVVLTVVLALAISDYVLKPIVHRSRPFIAAPSVPVVGQRPHDSSFPSGHATSSFAGAVSLARLLPQAAVLWWTLAVAIAYSRIYIGVHYPSDVVAGAALGIAVALLTETLARWRAKRIP
ncbi:MAG TPA: phosphatase PAP2 family protein [Vicinamibacterales bacterium]|jgi:undecaprenyl-diphosphatase